MEQNQKPGPGISPKPSSRARSIGAILLEQGRLKPEDIEAINAYAGRNSLRFGAAAIALGLLTQEDIDAAVARQFNHTVLLNGHGGVAPEVIAAHDPQSERVEPIRALRSELTFGWLQNRDRKVLAVTSPDRREGRSWIAANLAVAFAQVGQRVLLIDADLRHPSQHQLFNLDSSYGLSALLTGRSGFSSVARVHPELRLYVVSAGHPPPNPQELLSRPIFEALINRLATQYDLVLIDTPAAGETADAQVVAGKARAAVIVGRRNFSRHSRLTVAAQRLRNANVDVVGCILNEH